MNDILFEHSWRDVFFGCVSIGMMGLFSIKLKLDYCVFDKQRHNLNTYGKHQ